MNVRRITKQLPTLALLVAGLACLANCGGLGANSGGGSSSGGSSSGSSGISLTPGDASVLLGDSVKFSAQNAAGDALAVNWSVNGVPGGNATAGEINASGEYTAPTVLPSTAAIQIAAAAQSGAGESASATVTLSSGISVELSPVAVDLAFGATQQFSAQISSSGHPNPGLRWSVDGVTGGNSSVGTIQAASVSAEDTDTALYTAPAADSEGSAVKIVITSAADPSKSAQAVVNLRCADAITPAHAAVALSQALNFTVTWCSTPTGSTSWTLDNDGAGNAAVGQIASTGAKSATYTAPIDLPGPATVTVHAAKDGKTLSATVTIESTVSVALSPASAVVALGGRVTLVPTVTGTADTALAWRVNGITGGSGSAGQICVAGSNPCQSTSGPLSGPVDYLPPAAIPSPATVTVTARSRADASRSANAAITVIPQGTGTISVSISPAYSFPAPAGTQQFSATVAGTSNSAVRWSVENTQGGCAGTACGLISSTGLYTAPNQAPSPNSIIVEATSTADPTASGTASVAINSGPTIQQLLPSSVMAGVASSFTVAVVGTGFAASTGAAASTILINGSPRATVCQTTLRCTITLQPGDVSAAGTLTVQVQNPGAGAGASNVAPFVVVPFTLNEGVIALTAGAPKSAGDDVSVFEPTTAGATPSQINVDYAGPITGGSTCNFDSSPIEVLPPSSGSAAASICVHGNDLDPSFFYEFSGSATPDIGITPLSLASLFPNLVQLNLSITNATVPGVRSLFITTPNNDKAVATGLLEVQ